MRPFASIVAAILSVTAFASVAVAQDIKRGDTLLARECGRCHATGRAGNSPLKDAPALRTLAKRYPIDSLEEALGEGIMTGHPEMPEFKFEPDDVGAIIGYLKSIQQP